MAAPSLAEFVTTIPSVQRPMLSHKDLQCVRIFALAGLAVNIGVTGVADYRSNLTGTRSSLIPVAESLIGKIPDSDFEASMTRMLYSRLNAIDGSSSDINVIMRSIKALRECNPAQLNHAELYMMSLLIQSAGL